MNERYVLDAYAWIEYLAGREAGVKVKEALEDEGREAYTCAVTIAEVVSKIARSHRDPRAAYDVIVSDSGVLEADDTLSEEAGLLHARIRETVRDFGLADAYVLACSRRLNASILTGDPHFQGFKEAVFLR